MHKELAVQIISCVGSTDAPEHKLVHCWHFPQGANVTNAIENGAVLSDNLHEDYKPHVGNG
ncbi:hypothetical protein HaLaN_01161 [Haematococcus lacustris]|uniref:Uncharacterized protein n=1 Tax=Haematococcus lacustris TaxID=44745 RepID=A0A699YHM3_HAELA|nr:hypothetical protein HaLaN_01161 [Haematococcus lacustris]